VLQRGADLLLDLGATHVVDEDDLALRSERIGQRPIPIVQVAPEVLKQDEWQVGRASEATVGEVVRPLRSVTHL
jgi:hypothetical protein